MSADGRSPVAEAMRALAKVERVCANEIGSDLFDLCRFRIATLLRSEGEARRTRRDDGTGVSEEKITLLARWPSAPQFSDAERAALAFTEQFVVDVNGIDQALVDGLLAHMAPDRVYVFTRGLQACEARQRIELVARHDPDLDFCASAAARTALGSEGGR